MKEEKRIANALESIAKSLSALVKETKANRELKQKLLDEDLQEVTSKIENLKENFFDFDDTINN